MDAPRVYQLLLAPISGMPIPSQEIGNAPEVVVRARKTLLHTDICVGVPKQRVSVSMSTTFDRKPHSSDGRIQEIWDEKTQEATRKMFDNSKFRLHALGWTSAEGQSVGSCESTRSCLRIELGLTGYKEYIGTNRRPADDFSMLEDAGRDSFADARAHFSNALGVEALLITIDKTVVLLRRSGAVATNSGEFNGPSGHPEPSAAGISAHCSASASEDQRSMVDAAALNEIYDAVLQEIVEETNVPKSTLSEPLLIGVGPFRTVGCQYRIFLWWQRKL